MCRNWILAIGDIIKSSLSNLVVFNQFITNFIYILTMVDVSQLIKMLQFIFADSIYNNISVILSFSPNIFNQATYKEQIALVSMEETIRRQEEVEENIKKHPW